MIVRDWRSGVTVHAAPWGTLQQLGQVKPPPGTVEEQERWLFQQLRALSHSIAPLVQQATAETNPQRRQALVDNIAILRDRFADVADAFTGLPSGQPPVILRMLATLNTWLRSVVGAPLAVVKEAAVEVIQAAGEVSRAAVGEGGKVLLSALVPVGLVAIAAIVLVGRAERTRTYRRYVA